MPDYGVVSAEHDAVRLMALAEARGVRCADLFSAFASRGETLYFAHDSHWNSRGAALAADVILGEFGRESDLFGGDFSQSERHDGDLFEMLYPAFRDSEENPVYGGALDFSCEGNVRPDSITINAAGGGSGSLLAFRDSFGNLLYPYLAADFASSRFSRATAYDLTLIDGLGADCVLIELVERNLDHLVRNIPVMPAPEREAPLTDGEGADARLTLDGGVSDGLGLIGGTLGLEPDLDSPVYIISGGHCREAFLLEENGFAAYIPEGEDIEAVILISGGKWLRCTVK